jgi:16S rRNA (guanine1207-N2)-methyltransferase
VGAAPGQYFDRQPGAPSRTQEVRLDLPERSLRFTTDRGVFSADRVDPGTRYLLLEAPPPPETGMFLDLGCGYGPIACTLAARAPAAAVRAVDVNERAVALCQRNAAANGLSNVTASTPDGVPGDLRFDLIWSNPPIRIGKAALHDLLLGWLGRLRPDGQAVLVVQKHLGSDSLQRWLGDRGHAVERIGSRAGYRLLTVGPGGAP